MDSSNSTAPRDDDVGASLPYLHTRLRMLFLFLLLGYGIMCLLSCALVVYLRVHRQHAFAGDQKAACRVILPAFEPLLLVLASATFIYTVYLTTALATNMYAFNVSRVTTEVFYSGRQFVFLSVIVFMLQPSVSRQALKKSVAWTFALATYTVPIVALLTYFETTKRQFYVAQTTTRALLLLLYAYIFVKPPPRASKASLREFCLYAFVYYALLFGYNARFFQQDAHFGFLLTYANLIWGSLCPLVIWRVLQADTEHWRRLGQRAVALQQNLSSSLSSTATSSLSSSRRGNALALECTTADGTHVLVEMHRKYVIDFAYLELKQTIARRQGRRQSRDYEEAGDTAVTRSPFIVYRGVLRGQFHVAVKAYTPALLDEETIAQFAQEAALCGALRHPNVVHFVGMCVRPPTICMVTELCVGNLETVTRAHHRKYSAPTNAQDSPRHQRQQLLVNISYMLDAARAVAYLHSFSPPFLHRDITPASFLVDGNGTVKLTDFGDSRSLPARRASSFTAPEPNLSHTELSSTLPLDLADLATPSSSSFSLSTSHAKGPDDWNSQLRTPATQPSHKHVMTIKGSVQYMAPELLQGHAGHACYGEAADVFALAVTMWDILYPSQEKYPRYGGNRLKIFEAVLAGERPSLDATLPATLYELLSTAWHEDPRLRPSGSHVVSALESLQEELMAPFAQQLVIELTTRELFTKQRNASLRETVTGEVLTDLLVDEGYVDDDSEALRLGNALLDASIVHHNSHTKPFESSDREMYYFDSVKIQVLCAAREQLAGSGHKRSHAPLSRSHGPLGASSTASSHSELVFLPSSFFLEDESKTDQITTPRRKLLARPPSAPVLSRRARRRDGQLLMAPDPVELLCPCRKLGQRLQDPSTSNSSFRRRVVGPGGRPTLDSSMHELRKVKSSPVLEQKLLASASVDDEGLPVTDRMTDWEDFVLAIEDSDNEDDGG